MHQIRVHLQSLGFSITNDQTYGGTLINDEHTPVYKNEDFFTTKLEDKEDKETESKCLRQFLVLWLHASDR